MAPADPWPEALRGRLRELMRAAIAEARRADWPFGCALADFPTGELLAAVGNSGATDATAHAEMNALRLMAEKKLDARRIVLVSTAEPCPMCATASWWAQVRGVVWGTSIATLTQCGFHQIELSCSDVLARAKPPSSLLLLGGYLTEETDPLYRQGPKRK
ncbi:MAG: deaminase [Isosphaeraceae bacterium]|nr:deaminase [Isosphaeraceae bacterium]